MKESKEIIAEKITTAQIKLASSLGKRRERSLQSMFALEGTRSVLDSADAFDVEFIAATPAWIAEHGAKLHGHLPAPVTARAAVLQRISSLKTPQGVIAVCHIPPQVKAEELQVAPGELVLALDTVQDPGNVGTIVRLADWFGIRKILATATTADIFSAKATQASMGAVARVTVAYGNLPDALKRLKGEGMTIYGTFLHGENLYHTHLDGGGVIVLGNEGNGISPEVGQLVTHRISIPPYSPPSDDANNDAGKGMESLNVAMAASITVAEFRRRIIAPTPLS